MSHLGQRIAATELTSAIGPLLSTVKMTFMSRHFYTSITCPNLSNFARPHFQKISIAELWTRLAPSHARDQMGVSKRASRVSAIAAIAANGIGLLLDSLMRVLVAVRVACQAYHSPSSSSIARGPHDRDTVVPPILVLLALTHAESRFRAATARVCAARSWSGVTPFPTQVTMCVRPRPRSMSSS